MVLHTRAVTLTAAVRRRLRERTSLPRDVLVLGLIAFCVAVGFGVLVPVLPVFARSFGVGNTEVGAVISVFALMRLAVSPLCGRLIGWMGERTVLATGIFIVAASSGVAGAAQTYPQLLALRGIGGHRVGDVHRLGHESAAGQCGPEHARAGRRLLPGRVPARRDDRSGHRRAAGPDLDPGAVLLLRRHAGRGRHGRAAAAVADQGGARGGADRSQTPCPSGRSLADPRFQAACLTNLAQGWTSFGVRSALIPVLVVEVLHHSTTWTGIAFACAAITQTIALAPAGKFVDTVGRRPAMIGGGLLAGLSIMVVPFAPNLVVVIIALCAYGIAAAFLGTAPAASVGDATGGSRGTPVAVFSMFSDVGAIIGPIVAGLLADNFSYPWAFGLGAALLVMAAAYSVRMPRGVPAAHRTVGVDPPPVGDQPQVGGPESAEPTTKELR